MTISVLYIQKKEMYWPIAFSCLLSLFPIILSSQIHINKGTVFVTENPDAISISHNENRTGKIHVEEGAVLKGLSSEKNSEIEIVYKKKNKKSDLLLASEKQKKIQKIKSEKKEEKKVVKTIASYSSLPSKTSLNVGDNFISKGVLISYKQIKKLLVYNQDISAYPFPHIETNKPLKESNNYRLFIKKHEHAFSITTRPPPDVTG